VILWLRIENRWYSVRRSLWSVLYYNDSKEKLRILHFLYSQYIDIRTYGFQYQYRIVIIEMTKWCTAGRLRIYVVLISAAAGDYYVIMFRNGFVASERLLIIFYFICDWQHNNYYCCIQMFNSFKYYLAQRLRLKDFYR